MTRHIRLTLLSLASMAALSISTVAQAQAGSSRSGWNGDDRTPWASTAGHGYLGASIGRSNHDLPGCLPGSSCDDNSDTYKAFIGGTITPHLGLELGYVHLGDLDRNNGEVKAQGANLGVVGFLPLAKSLTLLGKIGGLYSWTRTTSNNAGVPTGKENSLGLSYGVGIQWDMVNDWALRGDWDRYRIKYVSERQTTDTFSLAIVYKY